MLVTLHTILPKPSSKMKKITTKIINLSTTIVVLTANAKEIIEKIYPECLNKIYVIPHGIHSVNFSVSYEPKTKLELKKHIILTTFGLLSSGKGIEYAIKALPKIIKKHPSVLYLVLGQTHPVVLRNEGEKYRNKLLRLITKLGLQKYVKFYDQYLNLPDLFDFLKATDIYISTSINPNQAVSGTLSYALGSGRAAISTNFLQAKEIVTQETGRLVPTKDSKALSTAVLDLLSNKKRLKQMHLNAFNNTRSMLWSNVAEKYIKLLERRTIPPLKIKHLQTMTDNFGLFQFATLSKPNKDFGYTLDDNVRALILCSWLIKQQFTKELEDLIKKYLRFINKCQLEDGNFTNYIGYNDKKPTIQNKKEDLEDTQTRLLWALSEIMSNTYLSVKIRKSATNLFLFRLNNLPKLTHLRAKAYVIKSLALAFDVLKDKRTIFLRDIRKNADSLVKSLSDNSYKSWHWFENNLSYNNALLSESLLIASQITNDPLYKNKGISSLRFLIGKTFTSKMYKPIGQSHWYKNNQERSEYDQQPEEPASMILALSRAYNETNNQEYKNLANICFSWFLGNNSLNKSLYNETTGGCYDGLHPDRVNLNQGAESLLSYLMSNFVIRKLNR